MNSYYLKFTTLSPVHIGSGEVYEPINFVIDGGYLYEFDEEVFFQSLSPIEQNLLLQKSEDLFAVIAFYKNHAAHAKKLYNYKIPVDKNIADRYKSAFNKDGSKNQNQFTIDRFYRSPNTYLPLIPGSSIKGVLDTILHIYAKPEVASNKVRQKLKVSDALCIKEPQERIGIAKRVYKKDLTSTKKGNMPVNLEFLRKGNEFICKIDTQFSWGDILRNVERFFNEGQRQSPFVKIARDSFTLRVGKFSGKPFSVYEPRDIGQVKTKMVYGQEEFGWVRVQRVEEPEWRELFSEYERLKAKRVEEIQKRRGQIKEKFRKEQEERRRIQAEKARRAKEEERKAKELKEAEERRLAQMSPFEKALYELQKNNPNPQETIDILLFNAIKSGKLERFQCEALHKLKDEMIKRKKWVETSKKPQKDKRYKRTQEVIAMLKECNEKKG